MTQFVGPSALEAKTSGTFDWRVCAGRSATCPATRSCLTEHSPPTFASCSRRPRTTICEKPFVTSASHLLSQRCPMASAKGSVREAANYPVASANGLLSREPFCNHLGSCSSTKQLLVLIRLLTHAFFRIF